MDAAARLLLVDLLCQAYNAGVVATRDFYEGGPPVPDVDPEQPPAVLPLSLARITASDEARRLALPPF